MAQQDAGVADHRFVDRSSLLIAGRFPALRQGLIVFIHQLAGCFQNLLRKAPTGRLRMGGSSRF